ncbi:Ribosome biogenesis protein 1 [Tyrophagus putrescentiae]|nr:Ribosome biogenesis protein 1 [Tyrophagus putrescentiae]
MASRAPGPKRGVKRKGPPQKNVQEEEVSSSGESEFEYEEYEDEEDDDDEEEDDEGDEGDEEDSDYEPQSDSEADMSEIGDDINLQEISDDEALGEEVADDAEGEDLFTKVLHDNDNTGAEDAAKAYNARTVQSISHDTKPFQSGGNVASVDEYEHDSSDEEDVLNTIGNIPYEWYKDYVHIGYDRDGRKIIKPPSEDEIDEFLRKMDDPTYWRTVKDNLTGQKVVLSDTDVDLLQRLKAGKCPDPSYDPYAPFIDFFTYEKSIHPAHNRPETKASFIPSVSEKRLVSRLVTAIKRARLKPKPKPKKDSQFAFSYDLWEHEADSSKSKATTKRHDRYIAAPKARPPGHEESYNPPPEYLFTEEERKAYEEAQQEEEEEDRPRPGSFIPQKFSRLRSVPAYPAFVKERFERCLDLYLCPRARKNRVHIDPEDLIPQLPKPGRPAALPLRCSRSSTPATRAGAVEPGPAGQFIVSGDDAGCVKVFEVLTGRCFKTISGLPGPVTGVSWYPNGSRSIVTATVDRTVYLINVGLGHRATVTATDEYFAKYAKEEEEEKEEGDGEKPKEEELSVEWANVDPVAQSELWSQGVRLLLKHRFEISQLTWHTAGEYFATVMPAGANKSVVIHHLSKRKSQVPFKKSKDIIKCVQFHPTRAYFFVATKKSVRVYDLIKQELTKKLTVNTCEVNCMAVHPGGDNVLIGGVDPKVQWFDMDLSVKAYKTLRYHRKGAVRAVQFHPGGRYPLFASASDDGTVVVCHGMVYDDLLQNALIVPVKVLKAPKDNSPMLHCAFHSVQPWLFACSTNTVRLFT